MVILRPDQEPTPEQIVQAVNDRRYAIAAFKRREERAVRGARVAAFCDKRQDIPQHIAERVGPAFVMPPGGGCVVADRRIEQSGIARENAVGFALSDPQFVGLRWSRISCTVQYQLPLPCIPQLRR